VFSRHKGPGRSNNSKPKKRETRKKEGDGSGLKGKRFAPGRPKLKKTNEN